MSLMKFNNRSRLLSTWNNRLFPWGSNDLANFLNSDNFFNDDFFTEDSLMPAMNIKENDKNFEIEFAAPGFSKKDFKISIDENILNVSGEKSTEEKEEKEDYSRKEFSYNSFKRSLKLPKSIDSNSEVKATYKNGILCLKLDKIEEVKKEAAKLIEVE
ncbi:Hsp20/alpha crystallin family protein [Urechidicola croceus]|uniref:Heat-shock protein n=1 Tax=Urechidicola croceus TaxID=1850246 RepID=A0A1D8P7W8_9FLAO|nr:Hsp20/alpha crystallin family protein [Urechidicola croceus]AOW20665.1 heat-shock protein [Urechidicola croceus]